MVIESLPRYALANEVFYVVFVSYASDSRLATVGKTARYYVPYGEDRATLRPADLPRHVRIDFAKEIEYECATRGRRSQLHLVDQTVDIYFGGASRYGERC